MTRAKKKTPKKRGPKPKGRADLFVAEYLVDHSATAAAIRCGYSKASAGNTGSKLVKEYAEEIQRKTAASNAKIEITAERILDELAQIAFIQVDGDTSASWLKAKVHSLELLGKRQGLWLERQEVNLINPVTIYLPSAGRGVQGVQDEEEGANAGI